MALEPQTQVIAIVVITLAAAAVWGGFKGRKLPMPPGPPQRFVMGNAHQMPKEQPWRVFQQWSLQYGTSGVDDLSASSSNRI
jgi:hypothetical protein